MYFKFSCSHCGKGLKVRQEHAGRKLGCPYCKGTVSVPVVPPPAMPRVEPEPPPVVSESGIGELRTLKATESAAPPRRSKTPSVAAKAGPAVKWADGTNVSMIVSGGIGLLSGTLFMAALFPFRSHYFGELFWQRGWVPFVLVFFLFWSVAILVLKSRKLAGQRASMLFDLLPTELGDDIRLESLDKFSAHVDALPVRPGASFLVNRVKRGLEHFRVRKSAPEVAAMMASQSEIDANAVDSSYTLLKVFIWAIPILGFIGTVIGISSAVGGFSGALDQAQDISVLKESLNGVTQGLATAFDTTLIALVMSMLVMFPTSSIQKSEEDLLNWVDEYCNENLIKRLNDGREGGAERGAAGTGAPSVVQSAVDAAMAPYLAELRAWTEKVDSLGGEIARQQVEAWDEVNRQFRARHEKNVAHLSDLDNLTDEFQDTLLQLADQAASVQQHTAGAMGRSAESMQAYFADLGRGLAALNATLEKLGSRQVVFQTQPRRRWRWPFSAGNDKTR